MTKRELLQLGEAIFEGLKSGLIAIQNATDQAVIENKSYATIDDIVGIVLRGRFTHEWTHRAPMPTPREGFAVAAINDRIYAIGGVVYNGVDPAFSLPTVEEYNPVSDTWSTKAPMPTRRACLGAAVVYGKLYAMGGLSYANGSTELDRRHGTRKGNDEHGQHSASTPGQPAFPGRHHIVRFRHDPPVVACLRIMPTQLRSPHVTTCTPRLRVSRYFSSPRT